MRRFPTPRPRASVKARGRSQRPASQFKLPYPQIPVILIEDDEAEGVEEYKEVGPHEDHLNNDTDVEDEEGGLEDDDQSREESSGEISVDENEWDTHVQDRRSWKQRLRHGSGGRQLYTQFYPGHTGIPSIDLEDVEDQDYRQDRNRRDRDNDEPMIDLEAANIIGNNHRPCRSARNVQSNDRDLAAEWAAAVRDAEEAAERDDNIHLRLLRRSSIGNTARATRLSHRAPIQTCLVTLPTRKRAASLSSGTIKKPRTASDMPIGPNTFNIPFSSQDLQAEVKVEVKTEEAPVTPISPPASHVGSRERAEYQQRPAQRNDGFTAGTSSIPSSATTLVNNPSPSSINNTNNANTIQNLNERITRLNGTITAMAAAVAATNDENATLQAENAELKAQLDQARTGNGQ